MNGIINGVRSVSGSVNAVNGVNGAVSAVDTVTGNANVEGQRDGVVRKATTLYVEEIVFDNYKEFPNIGKADILYVAKDELASYIFDVEELRYRCIGRDYNEIEVIQGLL